MHLCVGGELYEGKYEVIEKGWHVFWQKVALFVAEILTRSKP
jgi:hypothetical protein